MLQSDGNNTVNDRDSSSIDDDTVNNPGKSTVIKISTDASRSKVNDDTCPGYVFRESDAEIDAITTGELPGQENL